MINEIIMATLRIPYTTHKNLKIVSVFINGVKSTFILNMDQEQTILNSNYFTPSKTKDSNTDSIFLPKMSFYGLKPEQSYFKLQDLSSFEESGRTIHGIFGKDIIKGYEVIIGKDKLVLTN